MAISCLFFAKVASRLIKCFSRDSKGNCHCYAVKC